MSRANGPRRTARASTSHSAIPSDTCTNTTGEIGRKVPVPRSTIENGCPCSATCSRWFTAEASCSSPTSVGGSSVTWVGMQSAKGSPKDARLACSISAWGDGIAIDTPMVGTVATLPNARQQPHSVTHPGHRRDRHLTSPVGAVRQDAVQFCGVVEQLSHPLAEGPDGLDHDLGHGLLEVAVPPAGE